MAWRMPTGGMWTTWKQHATDTRGNRPMAAKVALITGVTGQDGSYLA